MKGFAVATVLYVYMLSVLQCYAQKQALIVGQTWKSNIDGLNRVMLITSVNYVEGTFAGQYGIMNSLMDELRGTFDKDGGNLVGWTISYRNSYLYGTQVWSGHFVNSEGSDRLAIKSLSLRTGPGYTPAYIISEYFDQQQLEGLNNENIPFVSDQFYATMAAKGVSEGQVWINRQRDVLSITRVNPENGTFAGVFKRERDKGSENEYSIRGEIGKDGSTLGWSIVYVFEDQQKLDYRNSIAWCGHINGNNKTELNTMWINTTEYKQLQNYIVTNVGVDKFILKGNKTDF